MVPTVLCILDPYPEGLLCLQYEVVRKATITYRPYHRNYYHSLAEAIFAVHLLACTYFQYCQHGDGSDLTAVFIDTIDDPLDWDTTLQSAIEALHCLTPRSAYTIKDPKLHDRVGVTLLSKPLTPCLVPLCFAIFCTEATTATLLLSSSQSASPAKLTEIMDLSCQH